MDFINKLYHINHLITYPNTIMKISLLILALVCSVTYGMAQIKMAQFPIKQDTISIFPYDSLTNIRPMPNVESDKKYNHLIGQKILSVYSERQYGRFDILDQNGRTMRYGTYEALQKLDGKVYTIDSISTHIFDVLFHLKPENSNSVIRVVWDDEGNSAADEAWVCLGYYEKIKQLYLGKELVYVWDDYGWSDGFIDDPDKTFRFMDYETSYNLAKKIPCNTIWTCTDVMVLPVLPQERNHRYYPRWRNRVILNVENQEYGKYYVFADRLLSSQNYFMTLEQFNTYKAIQNQKYAEAKVKAEAEAKKRAEWNAAQRQKLIDKYGEDIGYRIHNGEIWIGMTSSQCSESIGYPQRINRTTSARGTREQWVYHSRYLYFENGILVTIQD